ncbi:hypothetical protein AC578_7916 [Pseudocercospora eumusae]|uniref:Uncharacterized protein n=1 Tax=Pseudocercospora eumusae TaxID=321146 RepID=A0A139HPL2_9PEZI|nr:hypothetical protein AC578_7916 [Pseudocercospora eumusae]
MRFRCSLGLSPPSDEDGSAVDLVQPILRLGVDQAATFSTCFGPPRLQEMLLNQRGHKATRTAVIVLLMKDKLNEALPRPLKLGSQRRTNGRSPSFGVERRSGSNTLNKRGKSYHIDSLEGSTLNCLMTGSQEDILDEYKTKKYG